VRRLYGRLLDTLLATWGIAILIQQAVRLEFGLSFFGIHVEGLGPGLQNVAVPAFLQGAFQFAGQEINIYRTFIIVVTLLVTLVTWAILYRTSVGMQVRAIIRNRPMAAACGIDTERVNALTFAFGSGLAGIAGVMMSGFQDRLPRYGIVDGGRRVHGPSLPAVWAACSARSIRRHARRDQWRGRLGDQRYRGPRYRVRRGHPDHRPQAARLVLVQRALKMTRRRVDIAVYAAFILAIMLAPLFLEPFWLNRIAKYLVFGMLGIAVAMSWGYAGILNLGQGLFFGLGAYMLAMSLKLASPTSLQQGSDKPVPDFMLWNAEPGAKTDLCCINKASFLWIPFEYQWFGLLMGIVLPVAVATVLGFIMFRKRISGVFVSIITLALVLLVRLLVIDAQPLTNGFNGPDRPRLVQDRRLRVRSLHRADLLSRGRYARVILVAARLLVDTRAGSSCSDPRRPEPCALSRLRRSAYQTFFFAVSAASRVLPACCT